MVHDVSEIDKSLLCLAIASDDFSFCCIFIGFHFVASQSEELKSESTAQVTLPFGPVFTLRAVTRCIGLWNFPDAFFVGLRLLLLILQVHRHC